MSKTTTNPKANDIGKKSIVKPSTQNETQDASKPLHHKVLLSDCSFKIQTDITGAFVGNKVFGHGLHVQNDGNIHINTGPKRLGGGKLSMVSRGGVIHKSGPVYIERTGDSKNVGQKQKKAPDSISSAKKLIACSEMNYGNHINETHGTLYIRATHIVLDAVDSLTLKSGDATIMQSGQLISNTTKHEVNADQKFEKLTGGHYRTIVSGEDKLFQLDPRSSSHIVSFGHINRRTFGDYQVKSAGVGKMVFAGGPPLGIPFVKNRLNALTLSALAGNLAFSTKIGTIKYESMLGFGIEVDTGDIDVEAKTGNMSFKSLLKGTFEGTGGVDIKSVGDIEMETTTGKLDIKSTLGDITIDSGIKDVKVVGVKIYLN